jgi:hypothetical protein
VWVPSLIEGLNNFEISEARALLTEIANLKNRGLTAEDVVIDFVFKNIHPLKYRVHPAYLFTNITDPSRVTKNNHRGRHSKSS